MQSEAGPARREASVLGLAVSLDCHFAFLDRLRRHVGESIADHLQAITADVSDFGSVAGDALDGQSASTYS